MHLNQTRWLVTGGSEGIGLACAQMLLNKQAVVSLISRSSEKLQKATESLASCNCHAFAGDVSDEQSITTAVLQAVSFMGGLDGVIHAAGVSMCAPKKLQETSSQEYNRIMRTNTDGSFYLCRAVLPQLLKQCESRLILIASTASFHVGAGNSAYCASKFSLRALAETLIAENKETGVRISMISPGPVATTIWSHKESPPSEDFWNRMLQPQDIARIAEFLAESPPYVKIDNITVEPRM